MVNLFLTAFPFSSTVFFANRIDHLRDSVLHLIRIVDVPVHRKGCGGMTEAHLYLLRADFLLGEECCVRVSERMEANVCGKIELTFQAAKYAC